MWRLVELDDHNACYQRAHPEEIERRVYPSSISFLLLGRGGLDDEDGLDEQEYTGRLQELGRILASGSLGTDGTYWMETEEDDIVLKDRRL